MGNVGAVNDLCVMCVVRLREQTCLCFFVWQLKKKVEKRMICEEKFGELSQ